MKHENMDWSQSFIPLGTFMCKCSVELGYWLCVLFNLYVEGNMWIRVVNQLLNVRRQHKWAQWNVCGKQIDFQLARIIELSISLLIIQIWVNVSSSSKYKRDFLTGKFLRICTKWHPHCFSSRFDIGDHNCVMHKLAHLHWSHEGDKWGHNA